MAKRTIIIHGLGGGRKRYCEVDACSRILGRAREGGSGERTELEREGGEERMTNFVPFEVEF